MYIGDSLTVPSYHLWLVPEEERRAALRGAIEALATRYGGPVFEPHITLLTDVAGPVQALQQKTVQLAGSASPVVLRFSGAEAGQSYFQCVYLSAESTTSLLGLHDQARELFQRDPDRFTPHVSLLYGDFDPEVRRRIAAEVPPGLCHEFVSRQLQLIRAESTRPRDWHVVHEVCLG